MVNYNTATYSSPDAKHVPLRDPTGSYSADETSVKLARALSQSKGQKQSSVQAQREEATMTSPDNDRVRRVGSLKRDAPSIQTSTYAHTYNEDDRERALRPDNEEESTIVPKSSLGLDPDDNRWGEAGLMSGNGLSTPVGARSPSSARPEESQIPREDRDFALDR